MKVLFLTNNNESLRLANWIKEYGDNVLIYKQKLDIGMLYDIKPQIIVSYNYKYIISKEVIEHMNGKIVNLHISLLPWNRGASPNFWSFIDNTPKGVTIHFIDEKLDTGSIIIQKEVFFDEQKETFLSTYNRLNNEIIQLFKENWDKIRRNQVNHIEQRKISLEGSYHTLKDLQELKSMIDFKWDDNISEVKRRISQKYDS